jgi:hypothetical protein
MQGEIWNHIKKIFTIDRVNEDIQRWNEFLANGDTRRDYKCFGCGRFGRNDDVCMSVPICIICDTYFRPNVANPICRNLVLKYIPDLLPLILINEK